VLECGVWSVRYYLAASEGAPQSSVCVCACVCVVSSCVVYERVCVCVCEHLCVCIVSSCGVYEHLCVCLCCE